MSDTGRCDTPNSTQLSWTALRNLENLREQQARRCLLMMEELKRKITTEKLWFYRPNPKQTIFHNSQKRVRLFLGGNRSGKTEALVKQIVIWATGEYPKWYQGKRIRIPNNGWVVSLDFPASKDVIERKLWDTLPRNFIQQWRSAERTLILTNGSTISFKSCDSGREKFQGRSEDYIGFDEEPPYDIWQESRMRVLDTKGILSISMTPTNGMSWIFDEIYLPGVSGEDEDIEVVKASTYDNKDNLPKGEIDHAAKRYSEEERRMRIHGDFVEFAGLVYREFNPTIHVVDPFPIPEQWTMVRGLDPGITNPTAMIWAAVDPQDNLYLCKEYYETDRTVKENVDYINELNGNRSILYTVIDPSAANRNPITNTSIKDEYAQHGLLTINGYNDVKAGILKVKGRLSSSNHGKPSIFVFNTCHEFIKEITRYRWQDWKDQPDRNYKEAPKKSQDHLMDAFRYVVMSDPTFENTSYREVETENWYAGRRR